MNATYNTSPDASSSAGNRNAFVQARIEQAGPLLIAGIYEPLNEQAAQTIPTLWQRLTNEWHNITQRVGDIDYGVCIRLKDCEYIYLAGCAVWDFTELPAIFTPFIIPSQTYAVFTHTGSVQTICRTIDAAFDQWLPMSGYRHASAGENSLHFFERYGEAFDPQQGQGDIEIWLPVARSLTEEH